MPPQRSDNVLFWATVVGLLTGSLGFGIGWWTGNNRRGEAPPPVEQSEPIRPYGPQPILDPSPSTLAPRVPVVSVPHFTASLLGVLASRNGEAPLLGTTLLQSIALPPEPLAADSVFPPFLDKWINGPPPQVGSSSSKLLVVDLWFDWCPVCRQVMPGLVETFDKYRSKGVEFVSITNEPRETVEELIQVYEIRWPSTYAASLDVLERCGVTAHFGGTTITFPTLYLVGPDGKVIWNDHRSRYHHEPPKVIIGRLDAAIRKALGEPDDKNTPNPENNR